MRQLVDIPMQAFVIVLALCDIHDLREDLVIDICCEEDIRIVGAFPKAHLEDQRVPVAILKFVFIGTSSVR